MTPKSDMAKQIHEKILRLISFLLTIKASV